MKKKSFTFINNLSCSLYFLKIFLLFATGLNVIASQNLTSKRFQLHQQFTKNLIQYPCNYERIFNVKHKNLRWRFCSLKTSILSWSKKVRDKPVFKTAVQYPYDISIRYIIDRFPLCDRKTRLPRDWLVTCKGILQVPFASGISAKLRKVIGALWKAPTVSRDGEKFTMTNFPNIV